jgi:hypothetical protein
MHRLVVLDDRLALGAARLARAWCRLTGLSSRPLEYGLAVAIWACALVVVLTSPSVGAFGRGIDASYVGTASFYVFYPANQRDATRGRNPLLFGVRLLMLAALGFVLLVVPLAGLFAGWSGARQAAAMLAEHGAIVLLLYLLREPPHEPAPRTRRAPAPEVA